MSQQSHQLKAKHCCSPLLVPVENTLALDRSLPNWSQIISLSTRCVNQACPSPEALLQGQMVVSVFLTSAYFLKNRKWAYEMRLAYTSAMLLARDAWQIAPERVVNWVLVGMRKWQSTMFMVYLLDGVTVFVCILSLRWVLFTCRPFL